MRDYDKLFDNIDRASNRVRRLYSVAAYDLIRGYAKSDVCDLATHFARRAADDPRFHELAKETQRQCRALMESEERATWSYKTEAAVELAGLCVSSEIDLPQFKSLIWVLRGFYKSQPTDERILDCLDLTGPGEKRREDWSGKLPPHVVGIAQTVYDGDSLAVTVLADAMEEIGMEVKHLRGQGRHWQGCWVVDNILGRS